MEVTLTGVGPADQFKSDADLGVDLKRQSAHLRAADPGRVTLSVTSATHQLICVALELKRPFAAWFDEHCDGDVVIDDSPDASCWLMTSSACKACVRVTPSELWT